MWFFYIWRVFSQNSKNALLNITLTILGLREKRKEEKKTFSYRKKEEFEKNFITDKHFLVLDALTTLSNTLIEELNQVNRELEVSRVELERLASTDKLTGIYNRSKLDDFFLLEIERREKSKNNFGCAIFDIDHFKLVNDMHGHLAGDIVIKKL